TASLGSRVTPLHAASYPPAQKQPVQLLCQLLGSGGEPDAKAARLLTRDMAVRFEDAEDQIADDLGRDVGGEEGRRNRRVRRQASVDPRPPAELQDAVLLSPTVRVVDGYVIAGRFCLASQFAGDARCVLLQWLGNVDELDRCPAPHVAVTDEVSQQTGVLGRDRLRRTEPVAGPGPGHPVSGGQLAGGLPAALGKDLVIR